MEKTNKQPEKATCQNRIKIMKWDNNINKKRMSTEGLAKQEKFNRRFLTLQSRREKRS